MARAREREAQGVVRQCNEGKLEFRFEETCEASPSSPGRGGFEERGRGRGRGRGGSLVLEVSVPRYLDSSLIDVDVHPHYVSVVIKGKVRRHLSGSETGAGGLECLGCCARLGPGSGGSVRRRRHLTWDVRRAQARACSCLRQPAVGSEASDCSLAWPLARSDWATGSVRSVFSRRHASPRQTGVGSCEYGCGYFAVTPKIASPGVAPCLV